MARLFRRRATAVLGALVLALAVSGCEQRPTADEVSSALQQGTEVGGQAVRFPASQADCVAKVLARSDLSDDALRAITEHDKGFRAGKADRAVAAHLEVGSRCVVRPTAAEVSAALQDGVASSGDSGNVLRLNAAQADCVARVLVSRSRLADATLSTLVTQHVLDTGKANEALVDAVGQDLRRCGA